MGGVTGGEGGEVAAPLPLPLPLPYSVYLGFGLLRTVATIAKKVAPAHRYAVISDDTVAALHAEAVLAGFAPTGAKLFTMRAGEREKTRENWAAITDQLFEWGAGRDTVVVALGGGVVGDLGGFVASTFMRGVPVIQVPTTLLAMVDASIGGKTGIDVPMGKNLVGAFHNPSAVVMALESLETLPEAELRNGLAEIIKHGVVADAEYFELARRAVPALFGAGRLGRWQRGSDLDSMLGELIAGSARIKAAVVAEDHREGSKRQILNFGHTIGHAIEQVTGFGVTHGEAVAMGMVVEARIAAKMGLAREGLEFAIVELLELAGLPTVIPAGLDPTALLEATRMDKKARAGEVRYALPSEIGRMNEGAGRWTVPVPDEVVIASMVDDSAR